jgi:hypothetical protein
LSRPARSIGSHQVFSFSIFFNPASFQLQINFPDWIGFQNYALITSSQPPSASSEKEKEKEKRETKSKEIKRIKNI